MRLLTLFATLGLAILMTVNLPAQTVRVIFTSGQASMQRPDEAAPRPVVKGETIIIGTRIITGPDGRVVITPMPGVKSIIAPNTTLVLESASEARTSVSETTQSAILDLKEGSVVSDLQKSEGVTYDYSIRTARGLAGARGTTFSVGINAAGIQTIIVSHGSISINFADGRTATLTVGELSVTTAAGETRNVSGVAELPAEDQAAAQAFTETVIVALSDAVANGVPLAPDALANALAAAESLGVPISPEIKAAAESAIKSSSTTTTPTGDTSSTTTTTEVVTETVTPPDAFAAYRATLTADQLAAFNVLPTDIQSQLATLNDSSITAIALAPSEETGLAHTYQDLRIHLAAFLRLSAEQVTFLKGLSYSQNSDPLANSPDPAAWSIESMNRALVTWNGLTTAEQTMIIGMGAGEILVDRSASYISGLLAALDNTQQVLVTDMGWGHDLEFLAAKPTAQTFFTTAASLGGSERSAAKYFQISAQTFNNPNAIAAIQALASFDSTQQKILQHIGVGRVILNDNGATSVNTVQFTSRLNNALTFYSQLSSAQQEAVRALGLGYLLYTYAPNTTLGGGTTALQQVETLAQFYIDNPALRHAMRDSDLFGETHFQENPALFNSAVAVATLNTYLNLPERTRTYLATLEESYNFHNLANPGAASPYYSLGQINGHLEDLTPEEFGALMDMGIAKAVIETGYTDSRVVNGYLGSNRLATLRATLAAFIALPDSQKAVLRELGILGYNNISIIGADSAGLARLLSAYAALPGSLRAATERLDIYNAGGTTSTITYGNLANPSVPVDRSYFFPDNFDQGYTIQKIAFQATGDLHVGATRYLRIDNSSIAVETFVTGSEKDLYLRASDLIDLNSTLFSANIRGITMAAATVNLTNINFPEGSVASLNSSSGQIAFWSAVDTVPLNNGKVNFKTVSYGGNALTSLSDLTSPAGANGNIAIGSLASPAALPTYTPTAP